MWLIVTLIATIIITTIYLVFKKYRKKYKLGLLALMLWGTFLMVLVDHLIAFIGGEKFIEITTDGLIKSGTVLGLSMVASILVIWLIVVLLKA